MGNGVEELYLRCPTEYKQGASIASVLAFRCSSIRHAGGPEYPLIYSSASSRSAGAAARGAIGMFMFGPKMLLRPGQAKRCRASGLGGRLPQRPSGAVPVGGKRAPPHSWCLLFAHPLRPGARCLSASTLSCQSGGGRNVSTEATCPEDAVTDPSASWVPAGAAACGGGGSTHTVLAGEGRAPTRRCGGDLELPPRGRPALVGRAVGRLGSRAEGRAAHRAARRRLATGASHTTTTHSHTFAHIRAHTHTSTGALRPIPHMSGVCFSSP